jgi:hypothetical protein
METVEPPIRERMVLKTDGLQVPLERLRLDRWVLFACRRLSALGIANWRRWNWEFVIGARRVCVF